MIPWIGPHEAFPPVESALTDPNGLLAASPILYAHQLVDAYRHGIFPWYSDNEPIVWWSPDPRLVLRPANFKVSRSLRKRIQQVLADNAVSLDIDRDFSEVMRQCAAPRLKQDGTWITPQILRAYGELYQQGLAHSVEMRVNGELVGGLYGVALGRMFYGESMFARQADASKIALATLVQLLQREQVPLIDCQQETPHLKSLGAHTMSRADFCRHVQTAVQGVSIDWKTYRNEAAHGASQDLKVLLLTSLL